MSSMKRQRQTPEAVLVEGLLGGIGRLIATLWNALFQRSARLKPDYRSHVAQQWNALAGRAQNATAHEAKLLLIEADALVDRVLKELHLPGATMGERLRAAERRFGRLQEVWEAHRLRNRIVHEAPDVLKQGELEAAFAGYRAGLRRLGVL